MSNFSTLKVCARPTPGAARPAVNRIDAAARTHLLMWHLTFIARRGCYNAVHEHSMNDAGIRADSVVGDGHGVGHGRRLVAQLRAVRRMRQECDVILGCPPA